MIRSNDTRRNLISTALYGLRGAVSVIGAARVAVNAKNTILSGVCRRVQWK